MTDRATGRHGVLGTAPTSTRQGLGDPGAPRPDPIGRAHASPRRGRVESVDVLRGIVMILMALDHTRDYFGVPGDPTDPTNTSLFLTRWVTHLCAPTFFLLTGTGAFLSRNRWPERSLSRFLVTRGAWLVILELTLLRFAYQFNVDYRVTMLLVIWALGWAMITLGLLVHLPVPAIGAIGAAMIAGHNLLDGVRFANPVWAILHGPGLVLQGEHAVFAAYPLIPWVGVTAVGYALGAVFEWDAARRRRALSWLAAGAVAGFVLLRALNAYGDPRPWSTQSTDVSTTLSFLNTTKYPPSLLFLLMTLGPALLVLRALDGGTPAVLRPAVVYGRVPLFYFAAHFTLIHAAAVVACLAIYGSAHWMFESPSLDQYPFTAPPGWGFPLPVVYLTWLGVVIALYPACRWFAGVKSRRGGILRYF
jgi:uncharacterized membrane protein